MTLTLTALRGAVALRDADYPTCADWTPNDWVTALVGEVGEAANILKKVRRGDKPLSVVRPELAKELADVQIYLVQLSRAVGVDLEAAIVAKFDEVSARIGGAVSLERIGDVDILVST